MTRLSMKEIELKRRNGDSLSGPEYDLLRKHAAPEEWRRYDAGALLFTITKYVVTVGVLYGLYCLGEASEPSPKNLLEIYSPSSTGSSIEQQVENPSSSGLDSKL